MGEANTFALRTLLTYDRIFLYGNVRLCTKMPTHTLLFALVELTTTTIMCALKAF